MTVEHTLYRDYETRSALDLQEVGAHIYAKDPRTEVLCMAYAVDDEPISIWAPGDAVPPAFLEAAKDDTWVVSAFNDRFERSIESFLLSPKYGWPSVPLDRHRCTMAAALACGLPGNLEGVAAAFGYQKDMVGHRLMLEMCKPLAKLPKDDEDVVFENGLY